MTPKHDKTNWFLKKELLDGVRKFSQLEKKISKLLTDKEKGDALEVFAEAWLALNPVTQAEEVWPFEQIPSKLKRELRLDKKDMGVDGLVKTGTGENHAYQVKFRSGRPALTWRELSTFVGLADKTDRKLVFTNCEKLPPLLEKREDVFSVRGSNLDELGPEDFERMLVWLKTGRVKPEPKRTPREDQLEAMEKIEEAFKDKREKRATAVMACGTGKTVTALWTAERLGYKKILVLVPSLALLSQTLQEWMKETSWKKVSYICVCSDKTVDRGMDNWEVRQSDLPFPVGTDSEAVKEFFSKRTGGVKIVFSTYQSAHVVAEGMTAKSGFDFGIFDEAHKTAGRQGTKFAVALKDENLPIKKRLFLTATPRHYNVLKKDKEGEAELVYSMDDEAVYGRLVYELPFAEAAKKKIICGYKVLISVVTSEEVDEELLSKGEVLIKGDEIKARQVANQLALKRAVEKFPVKKAFTFHSFVKAAASFTSDGPEGLKTHLPEFETFHVSGAMPVSDRESLLHEFKDSKKSVMSNARCLTEGVNVPTVDAVAFMSPKKSKVDIVQAVGRAMRKAGRKKKGYILIPLFLQKVKDESIEDALERTDFGEVWDVLQAMSEQDEVLAEIISQAVFEKAKTKVKGYDDRKFKEKVEVLGSVVSLERLERAVTAKCIDKLGVSWDVRYGGLVAYKEEHGNCNVPQRYFENEQLGGWVGNQRAAYKKGNLNQEKIRKLSSLGFLWEPDEARWEEMYQELVNYAKKYGNCRVPVYGYSENQQLGMWVSQQRANYRVGRLNKDRVKKLDEISFAWDKYEAYWEEMYQELSYYKKQYGDCNVPDGYSQNSKLAVWVGVQRQSYKKSKLSKEKVRRLNELGFAWKIHDTYWEAMYQELSAYKQQYGDCKVPRDYSKKPKLAMWVLGQRQAYKAGKLDPQNIKRLNKLGFIWKPHEAYWEEMYKSLADYKMEHGHCNVPSGYSENPKLGVWVGTQRSAYKKGKLDPDKVKRLNTMGFVWDALEVLWEERYQKLVDYKKTYGNCNVAHTGPECSGLGSWVSIQRTVYKNGKLQTDRTAKLEKLGFVWNLADSRWEERFQELVEYKQKYGNCNVPAKYKENPSLGTWVNNIRNRAYKRNILTKEQIGKLNELGFVWKLQKS